MAKGGNRRNSSPDGTRDALQSLTVRLRSSSLQGFQDLRTFDFEPGSRPAQLFSDSTATVTATPQNNSKKSTSKVRYQIAFSAPAETLVCVRRRRRKEVLFAKNKSGKRGQKKGRWSKWSSYKC